MTNNEHFLFFNHHEIGIHFTQTNIIHALEAGVLINIKNKELVGYELLDDGECMGVRFEFAYFGTKLAYHKTYLTKKI